MGLWRTEDPRGSSIPSLSREFPGPQGVQAGASGFVASSKAGSGGLGPPSTCPWVFDLGCDTLPLGLVSDLNSGPLAYSPAKLD